MHMMTGVVVLSSLEIECQCLTFMLMAAHRGMVVRLTKEFPNPVGTERSLQICGRRKASFLRGVLDILCPRLLSNPVCEGESACRYAVGVAAMGEGRAFERCYENRALCPRIQQMYGHTSIEPSHTTLQ